jgi:hypothetical protein
MTDDRVPIEMIWDLLLPEALRAELGVTGVTITSRDSLTCRIDPGNAFERRASIRNIIDTAFAVLVSERYRPDDPIGYLCGSNQVPAAEVSFQLQAASGWACTFDEDRAHWYDARKHRSPTWSTSLRADKLASVSEAAAGAAERARRLHVTHFMYSEPGALVYGNNPPPPGTDFYSVTRDGNWSLHQGVATYPQEDAPDARSFARLTVRSTARSQVHPARLARADRGAGGQVIAFRPRTGSPASRAAAPGRHR